MSIYNYITMAAMLFMTLLILVQTRGASLGAGIGSSGEVNTERRGTDHSLHFLSGMTTTVFVLSLLLGIIIHK